MNRLSDYFDIPKPSILPTLAKSLRTAFSVQGMEVEEREDEIVLTLGTKKAWINSRGELTGEANSPTSEP